ncbi:hypothetical protein [Phenylobacterium sp.]|uniref:hypothetical protein n=1 Tax=Phenylobacterium sp. TaxID=1871053 RepID=UPI0019952098|nr:hypothetical protein [Phenylobacterium sp.]MBC7168347.1 hypothetical protein [Phenylobacterium sp.]
MSRRSPRARWLAAITAVLVLHAAAGLALLSVRPTLPFAPEPRVFEVTLLAPVPRPQLAAETRSTAQAGAAGAAGAPTVLSARPGEAAPATAPVVAAVSEAPDAAAQARFRSALRSRVGCASPEAWGLTQDEREACLERLAQGAAEAPYRPPVLEEDKQRAFDAAAARKAAYRAYKESTSPPLGIDTTGGGPVMNPLPDP